MKTKVHKDYMPREIIHQDYLRNTIDENDDEDDKDNEVEYTTKIIE